MNVLGCKEDDDEEGCVNMVTAENEALKDGGWKTPDDLWLDLEEEDNRKIFHVIEIIEKAEHSEVTTFPLCITDKDELLKGKSEKEGERTSHVTCEIGNGSHSSCENNDKQRVGWDEEELEWRHATITNNGSNSSKSYSSSSNSSFPATAAIIEAMLATHLECGVLLKSGINIVFF